MTASSNGTAVEIFLKGSLDLIPSPSHSLKIQIMGGKICLRCKGKTLLGVVNKLFVFKIWYFSLLILGVLGGVRYMREAKSLLS